MFYDQFISLCKRDNVKPTPLIKQLGFSAGNIKRWENGATVNSDILLAVSKHFKVSIDYLLNGIEEKPAIQQQKDIQQINGREKELLKYFRELSDEEQIRLVARAEVLAEQAKFEESVD